MYFYDLESGTFVGMSLTLHRGFETNLSLIEKPGMSVGLRFYCYLNRVQLLPWPVCDCLIIHPGKGGGQISLSAVKKGTKSHIHQHKAWHFPLYQFLKSHFTQVYKLKAFHETKMENIPLSNVSLSKRPIFFFYLCHATQVTSNIFCGPSPLPVEKKRIWSLPCYACQLVMEILIATIKYFSKTCPQIHYHSCWSGSCERERHKSRRGIVIRNRWTLNHRWFWERAKQSLPLRKKRGKGKNSLHPLKKQQVLLCLWTWAWVQYSRSIDICHRALWDCRLCFCAVPGKQCFLYVQHGVSQCSLASPAAGKAKSEFW